MNRECAFCLADLGTNASIPSLPIGQRIAIDAAARRLWVVCTRCNRWNLLSDETGPDVLVQVLKVVRGTRAGVSASREIHLIRVAGDLTVIVLGSGDGPRFASWRYGPRLIGRWRRWRGFAAASAAAATGAAMFGLSVGIPLFGFAWIGGMVVQNAVRGLPDTVVARIPLSAGRLAVVRRRHLADSSLVARGDYTVALCLACDAGEEFLEGPEALRALRALMPAVNQSGASPRQVELALALLDAAATPDAYLFNVADRSRDAHRAPSTAALGEDLGLLTPRRGLFFGDTAQRLAVEMALNERDERCLDAEEARDLRNNARLAKEIAAIMEELQLDLPPLGRPAE